MAIAKKNPPKRAPAKKVTKKVVAKKTAAPKKVVRKVPFAKFYNGRKIPMIGLGTFGSDHMSNENIGKAVKFAIENGYRFIDCARVYYNEKEVGKAIKACIKAGTVARKDLHIVSKLANQDWPDVEFAVRRCLKDLQIDYLDTFMIHWPVPNEHPPGCTVDSLDPNAVPWSIGGYMKVWRQMETMVKKGLVKNIACSNMTASKLRELLKVCKIKPVANEFEGHPCFQQQALVNFHLKNGIVPICYCPIGSPSRPERDRQPEDVVDIEEPVILRIAKRLGVHPATVCVKWAFQRGTIPIPMSANPRNILANIDSVISDPLTKKEMQDMKKCEKGSRLIKGQVFMWPGSNGWPDLWK